jgi:hypothetical protein
VTPVSHQHGLETGSLVAHERVEQWPAQRNAQSVAKQAIAFILERRMPLAVGSVPKFSSHSVGAAIDILGSGYTLFEQRGRSAFSEDREQP